MTPDQIAQASRHHAARIRLAQQPPLRGTPSAQRALAAIVAAGPPDITHLPPRGHSGRVVRCGRRLRP
mgnify:FL=1